MSATVTGGYAVGAGLGDSDLRLVRAMIDAHGAKKVLILSTELVRPMFMKLADSRMNSHGHAFAERLDGNFLALLSKYF